MKKKKPTDDWHISDEILRTTLDNILEHVKVSREFDVPYVAGYSKNTPLTIYIDRNMPEFFVNKEGKKIFTDKFLILHEAIEKTLIDMLGLHYQYAHQIALRIERETVIASGISWNEYNIFTESEVKVIGSEKIKQIPSDLDTTPYQDEKDFKLLKTMLGHKGTKIHSPLFTEILNKKIMLINNQDK